MLDKSSFGLHPCRARVAHGLIFICLAELGDPKVADFDGIANDLDAFVATATGASRSATGASRSATLRSRNRETVHERHRRSA